MVYTSSTHVWLEWDRLNRVTWSVLGCSGVQRVDKQHVVPLNSSRGPRFSQKRRISVQSRLPQTGLLSHISGNIYCEFLQWTHLFSVARTQHGGVHRSVDKLITCDCGAAELPKAIFPRASRVLQCLDAILTALCTYTYSAWNNNNLQEMVEWEKQRWERPGCTRCPFNGWQGWSLEDRKEYPGHSLLPTAWVSLLFWEKGSLLVDTGHLWKRGNPSCRASQGFKAGIQFAMAAPIGTHSTLGVAGVCQHSLPSTTEVDASSRSPLERNKGEMLYTLMTFPQWLSKTKAAIKLLCRGLDCPQPNRGSEILSPLYTLYQQPTGGNGVIIRSLCGMGPTGDSLGIAATPLISFTVMPLLASKPKAKKKTKKKY